MLIIETIVSVIMDDIAVFGYMALVLSVGLFVIREIEWMTPNYLLRKCFHGLVFVMLTPPAAIAY